MEKTERIYGIIKELGQIGSASFAEAQRKCEEAGIDIKGQYAICWPGYDNLILWLGISEDFHKGFQLAVERDGITLKSTTLFVYFADGMVPSLPVAKSEIHYKSPHFLPTVFCVGDTRTRKTSKTLLGAANV